MEDCLFCKIAKKQITSAVVYEDEKSLAFRDINPQAPVHLLIIPKEHIPTVLDLTEKDKELLMHLILVVKELTKREGIDGGFRVVMNCGSLGGQTVYHLHLHLLGGRFMGWPPG